MAPKRSPKSPGPGDVFELIEQMARRLRQIRQETVREARLTPAQYYALGHLWQRDEQPLKELADASCCTRATMTGIVDSLEKGGYVVRAPNPDDRRSLLAKLTAKGRSLRARTPRTARLFDHCCSGLSQSELDQLHTLLTRVADSLGETRSCEGKRG